MDRRRFLQSAAFGYAGLTWPSRPIALGNPQSAAPVLPEKGQLLMQTLLRQWCDGMLRVQIDCPANPAEHGALGCPACGFIHGRCMDAVYPFLHMAKMTGNKKYLDAGRAVFEWSKNVEQSDGSWTVIADPKSWRGITVFGAIALAEALHWHGDLLETPIRQRWLARLGRAGDYIYKYFDLEFTNINYGCTAVYALALLGRVLDKPAYRARSRELASGIKAYLTEPNRLLFGEGHPMVKSPKGLWPVDLGYNVEESLNGLALYALLEQDREFRTMLVESLKGHLAFMLPDGAWDNSWGTRHFKWSYWGSRTTDGCQPAYALLADVNPAFGAAAYHNTRLMQACTHEGLLYGGPHYAGRGVKPCVHHTFTHAKALATVLDWGTAGRRIDDSTPLPRQTAGGVTAFPEVATWLAAQGPWRATVTAYDSIYKEGVFHPTGGALSMLWHRELGPLLAGSMARYRLVEKNNMQSSPDAGDETLTPRIEAWEEGQWFTNLYDLQAEVSHATSAESIEFTIETRLVNENQVALSNEASTCTLIYRFDGQSATLRAVTARSWPATNRVALVIPLVSPSGEPVNRVSQNRITIAKPGGIVTVTANVPLHIPDTGRERIFNLVPGFEAVPIVVNFPQNQTGAVECRIEGIVS